MTKRNSRFAANSKHGLASSGQNREGSGTAALRCHR
jgi:hypothetical protein